MSAVRGVVPVLLAGWFGACAPTVPDEPIEPLTVAVQNLYVGADLTALLSAGNGPEVLETVAREYSNIRANDYPQRAAAIAGLLSADPPQLIGLQEASLFRRQSPGDALVGNPEAATRVELDFLDVLVDEMRSLGVSYRVAAAYVGLDVEVPVPTPDGSIDDIRLTDRGVILAREGVVTRNPVTRTFETNLMVRLGGPDGWLVELAGGWASVEAEIGGRSVRFVTTHLESGDLAPEVQGAQARELLDALAVDTLPIVLVGDFSSTPDGRLTPTYRNVLDAGFSDAWAASGTDEPGATCCQSADIRNPASELTRRLDFVFYRDPSPDSGSPLAGTPSARLLGSSPLERTVAGLWPSDHAGIHVVFGVTRP